MQFELLFSSICDFVKIDVLTLPLEQTLLSTILCLIDSFLAGCLFSVSSDPHITKKEFNKNQKKQEPENLLPYNLEEKQGPQNRLVLRVLDLYF